MATIPVPTDEIVREKFAEYTSHVGNVAHAWNYLQEILGRIFAAICLKTSKHIMLSIWFSQPNDRAQRRMLRAAIAAGALNTHSSLPAEAVKDILWLLDECDKLGRRRDVAMHTPCTLFTSDKGSEIRSAFYSANPMAIETQNMNLLKEFKLSYLRAAHLGNYARTIEISILRQDSTPGIWPKVRPALTRETLLQQPG